MRRPALLLLLTLCLLPGCASDGDGPPQFNAVARDRQQLFEHLEGEVAVVGKAETSPKSASP